MTRWVVLAITVLVVIAAFGFGPGTAGATAGSLQVDQNPFTTGCTVTVNATAGTPGNDLTFVIDGNNDGQIEADEHLGTVNSSVTENVTFAPRDYVPAGGGDFNISVVEESSDDGSDDTSYPVTDIGGTYDQNLTLTVDGTAPTISNYTVTNPTGTDVEVSFNASEDLCAVSADVTGTENGTLDTADFTGSQSGGGYVYNATFFPAGPGNYTVTLENATDGGGNDGAASESASVVAGSAHRNENEILHRPATVYVGEEGLDLTSVSTGSFVTLTGVSGAADGTVVETDVSAFSATAPAGVETGGYNLSGGETTDIQVRDPVITDLTLVPGNGSSDIDVTNGSVPPDRTVTTSASYTFDEAANLEVSVEGPDGVDVTPELAGTPLIPASGEDLELDFPAADLEAGTYTITVEGETLDVSKTATVRIAARDTTLSLSRTRVTRGETVRATVFGETGGNVTVRVHRNHLADGYRPSNASDLYGETGDVETRRGVGSEYAAVELLLGRDGIGTALIRTDLLAGNASAAVEVVDGDVRIAASESTADSVPLQVDARTVAITDVPSRVVVGDDFTIAGSVPQAETVKAYALVDDAWVPLEGTGSGSSWASDDVGTDGAYTVEADAGAVVDQPDEYRIAVAADPDYERAGVTDGGVAGTHADDVLSRPAMAAQVYATRTVRTETPGVDVRLTRTTIAATGDDAVSVRGTAPGTETVHLYRVGPRGGSTGTTVDVDNGTFDHEIPGLDRRGRHVVFVASPGRDGTFAAGPPSSLLPALSGATPDDGLAILRDRYSGAGVDDAVVERSLRAVDPSVGITTVSATPGPSGRRVTVAGTSTREAGHGITVEAMRDGAILASTTVVVHEEGPTWNATLAVPDDTTGLTIRADGGESAASRAVDLRPLSFETAGTSSAATERPAGVATPRPERRASPRPPAASIGSPNPTPTTAAVGSAASAGTPAPGPREPGGLDPVSIAGGAGTVVLGVAGWRWLLG